MERYSRGRTKATNGDLRDRDNMLLFVFFSWHCGPHGNHPSNGLLLCSTRWKVRKAERERERERERKANLAFFACDAASGGAKKMPKRTTTRRWFVGRNVLIVALAVTCCIGAAAIVVCTTWAVSAESDDADAEAAMRGRHSAFYRHRDKQVSSTIPVVLFPTVVDPRKHASRIVAIRETWGKDTLPDGTRNPLRIFVAASSPGEVKVAKDAGFDDEVIIAGKGDLSRTKTHARIFATVAAAHSSDWIVKADTITYLRPKALAKYLQTVSLNHVTNPKIAVGRPLKAGTRIFLSGGAGFALSRAAAIALSEEPCEHDDEWLEASPDVGIAECFQQRGVDVISSAAPNGQERFHAYGPTRTVQAAFDPWFLQYVAAYQGVRAVHFYRGVACCAADSVSFHYVEADVARTLHRVEFLSRDEDGPKSANELAELWPKSIGGHARRPASGSLEAKALWSLLGSKFKRGDD